MTDGKAAPTDGASDTSPCIGFLFPGTARRKLRAINIMDGVWFEVIDGIGRLVGCVVGVGGIGSA